MAQTLNGILGAFSGRIGPVVGCVRGDTFYIRSRPRKRSVAPTQKLLASRAAFALVQSWLAPLKPVLKSGFAQYSSKTGGVQSALGYTLKHAVAGEYPNPYIDIPKVKLSIGDLPGAEGVTVAIAQNGELHFTWTNSPQQNANPFDQAMPVAYNISRGEAVYKTTGNFRQAGEDILQIPDSWTHESIHLWLAFTAADRSIQSDSLYLGEVVW